MSSSDRMPAGWRGTARMPLDADAAFNGYVASTVVFGLETLGLLDRLATGQPVPVGPFCAEVGADRRAVDALVGSARDFGLVTVRDGAVALTSSGERFAHLRGFFTWAVGGYHDLLAASGDVAAGRRRFPGDVDRNEGMVALGSAQAGTALMSGILDKVLAELDIGTIADLGSGTAARLCHVVGERPEARGVAVDISRPATALAERTIARHGLSDRVQAFTGDVRRIADAPPLAPIFAEVDTVMSFFLLHDLLADPGARPDVLPRLRSAFPRARQFLLADTVVRPPTGPPDTLPVFSAGFELVHALMGVPLYTREDYEQLFADAGMAVRAVEAFGAPHSWLFVLEVR